MKRISITLVMVVLFLGMVSAGTCTIGSTDCSNGEDDDGDGTADYLGVCSDVDCSSYKSAAECESACTGTYTDADSDCYSPLDTSEEGVVAAAPALAPEEEGIFSRFIDWLIFWN